MKRVVTFSLSAMLLVGIGVAVVECGGSDSNCGNGVVEPGEQCDNGPANGSSGNSCSASCTLQQVQRASLQVTYERLRVNVDSYPSFPAPTCTDLGIAQAHLVLTGPTSQDQMAACGDNFVFDPVDPGTYQATITLLDAGGNPVTRPVMSTMIDVQVGPMQNLNIVFDVPDYLRTDYKGNFDFLTWWGTKNTACGSATPAVTKQTLTLTKPGDTTPIAMMTNTNEKLDGSSVPCFTKSAGTQYQEVAMMPWGYYDLTVTGISTGTTVAFCKKLSVFVGVGVGTPTYDLVVDPLDLADGGAACP
jgi:cysteine-rich repeat protein